MVTTDVDKAEGFLSRLKADRSFRDDFERDPFASFRAAGIEVPESILSSEVKILGEGDKLSICFVAVDPKLMWPYRYYFLENRTDRELYLESWLRVDLGGCPPRPPTDPYVRDYRIRFLRSRVRCAFQAFWQILGLGSG